MCTLAKTNFVKVQCDNILLWRIFFQKSPFEGQHFILLLQMTLQLLIYHEHFLLNNQRVKPFLYNIYMIITINKIYLISKVLYHARTSV